MSDFKSTPFGKKLWNIIKNKIEFDYSGFADANIDPDEYIFDAIAPLVKEALEFEKEFPEMGDERRKELAMLSGNALTGLMTLPEIDADEAGKLSVEYALAVQSRLDDL